MSLIKYIEKDFRGPSLTIIDKANEIIQEYRKQGFVLTLRQLYYQFVARDLVPNTTQSYKRLGGIINDGRLAGLIDWEAIEDRTRNVSSQAHWESPADILRACASQYRIDKWARQANRPEVWIEKEALAGVVEGVCQELDISFLSCRGYTSQSEMWSSSQRLAGMARSGQTPIILHFGDHDPSGIDMTRDIKGRLELFMGGLDLRRLALNMDQVKKHKPPPNPAKTTDSRFIGYVQMYGPDSWELDALEPAMICELIREAVLELRDDDLWAEAAEEEKHGRSRIQEAAIEIKRDTDD